MKQILKSLELIQDGETTITIKYEDAKGTVFSANEDCALSRAVKRELGTGRVSCGCWHLYVRDTSPSIEFRVSPVFGIDEYNELLKSRKPFKLKLHGKI